MKRHDSASQTRTPAIKSSNSVQSPRHDFQNLANLGDFLVFWGFRSSLSPFFEIRKVCCLMTNDVMLRDVSERDLEIFFEHQRDPAANHMAAFTAKDPADISAFTAKWAKILGDDSIAK